MDYKIVGGVAGVLVIGSVLYLYRPYDEKIKTLTTQLTEQTQLAEQYKHQYEEALNVISNTKTTVHTVIKKPDGTEITTDKNTENNTQVSDKKTDKTSVDTVVDKKVQEKQVSVEEEKMSKSRYSLAVLMPVWGDSRSNYGAEIGARIGDLPLWIQGGLNMGLTVTIGIRGEL